MNSQSLVVAFALAANGCQPVSPVGTQLDASSSTSDAQATTNVDRVGCGPSSCDLAQGEACCLKISSGVGTCDTAACPAASSKLSCDGPEDCNGLACCGSVAEGMACTGGTECTMAAQLRHEDADCPPSKAACCLFSYGEIQLRACAAAPAGSCL